MTSTRSQDSPKTRLPLPRLNTSRYLANTTFDSVLRLSGQLPYEDGAIRTPGHVGRQGLSVEDAKAAARLCALNSLATISHELGGLDSVRQVLRVTVYVAASADFVELPTIADAASQAFVEVLGDRGRHARSAIGVSSLPKAAPVEIEVDIAIRHQEGDDGDSPTASFSEE